MTMRESLIGRTLGRVVCVGIALGMFSLVLVQEARAQTPRKTWRLDDHKKTLSPGKAFGKWDMEKIAPVFGSGEQTFFQFVHDGEDKHYIHLKSGKNNSFSVGLGEKFEVKDWPELEWEWRVTVLPTGGDVRVKERDDQAGSICLIVNPGLFGFKSMCYLWENGGPKDKPLVSTKREDSRYLILRSKAEDGAGEWKKEKRNILADFKRVFGKDPDDTAIIGMQIDSDSTTSAGEVFYRNIVLHGP